MTTLVIDANVAMATAARPSGFSLFDGADLIAPPLLWPEVRSVLHVGIWRGVISAQLARGCLEELDSGVVKERRLKRLGTEAWTIADELGWAKTYDAEYLALARLVRADLATLDRRMQQAAERIRVGLVDLSTLR